MLKITILLSMFFSFSLRAAPVLRESQDFLDWLEKNKQQFANCTIEKDESTVYLCDHTEVDLVAIQKMFKLSLGALISQIQKLNVQVRYICDEKETKKNSKKLCAKDDLSQKFKKMSQLHGLYVQDQKTILLNRKSSKAVLIHEYVHHLQSESKVKVAGRHYKAERNQLQIKINDELDRLMLEIAELEKKKDKPALMAKANEFIQLNDVFLKLGKWQDYIDERSIFSLFLKNQKKFNLPVEDLELVKKNMRAICNRSDLKDFSVPECVNLI